MFHDWSGALLSILVRIHIQLSAERLHHVSDDDTCYRLQVQVCRPRNSRTTNIHKFPINGSAESISLYPGVVN